MKNIALAIIKVMNAVKGMEKNSHVGKGQNAYKGTKDQDVREVFNTALCQAGLCVLPVGIEEETKIDRWTEDTQYGIKQKQAVFTKVTTKYMLLHESGESIELAGYGHGVDPQDKGAGKATTYALKNCLLNTFITPVGKIDDTDTTHSDDIETPQKKVVEPFKKKAAYNEKVAQEAAKAGTSLKEFKSFIDVSPEQEEAYKRMENEYNKS